MPKLKKRPDGRYQKNIYIGKIDGVKKYKSVFGKTEREVEKKAREIYNQLDKGVDVLSGSTPFLDCAKKWLKYYKSNTSEEQYRLYEYRISVFSDKLGGVPVQKIKSEDLQAVLNDISNCNPTTNKPSSYKTVLNYKNTVQLMYGYLTENRYIQYNAATGLFVPSDSKPKQERRALTEEEQKRVKEFKHRAQLPAMISMLCGLRRGEISALQWQDIDFDNKTITINKSYDFKSNILKEPKTKSGIRTVPMPDELIKFLKPYKKKTGLVVKNTANRRLTNSGWGKLWSSYMTQMNLQYADLSDWKPTLHDKKPPMRIETFSFHCLRHTYATILYDAGVDLLTAKKLLGHSKVETTMRIYTHLSQRKEKLSIDKLNNYLNEVSQEVSQEAESA